MVGFFAKADFKILSFDSAEKTGRVAERRMVIAAALQMDVRENMRVCSLRLLVVDAVTDMKNRPTPIYSPNKSHIQCSPTRKQEEIPSRRGSASIALVNLDSRRCGHSGMETATFQPELIHHLSL
jgi:hypothetical protein